MKVFYRLRRKDLPFLRSGLGKLLKTRGDFEKIGGRVYAVGDRSIFELSDAGVGLGSVFYDNRIRRAATGKNVRNAIGALKMRKIVVRNPPGVITRQLWDAVGKAVKSRAKVFVVGEEDLAAVAVMLRARIGSLVAYGMPKKGLAVVKITKALKRRIRERLDLR